MPRTITFIHAGLLTILGCASPAVFTPEPTTPRLEDPQTRVLLVDLRMPNVHVSVVGPESQLAAMGQQALDVERARHRAFAEAFAILLARAGFSVIPETDAGDQVLSPGTRVLRLEVEDLLTTVNPRMGPMMGCIVFGSLTAGLGYLACLGTRNRIDQSANLNIALYDVSGLTSTRIERDGALVRVLDTSSLRPILRRNYTADIESGHHIIKNPSGDVALEFARAQGSRLAQVVYAAMAPDLQRALLSNPPTTPAATPAVEQAMPAPAATPAVEQATPAPAATPAVEQATPAPTAAPAPIATPAPTEAIGG